MSHQAKYLLLTVGLLVLLYPLLSSCGANTAPSGSQHTAITLSNRHTATPGNGTPQPHEVVLGSCQGSALSVTTLSPSSTQRSIYFSGARGNLYALNAQTGRLRWCAHTSVTGVVPCNKQLPCLPPPYVSFDEAAVVDGVVYVCASGNFGSASYTYAFNASDGSLHWRAKTDCGGGSIPFAYYAIPLVNNGVVYSGTYALRSQDGQVLWKARVNPSGEGGLSFQALVDGVIYANSQGAIYAINARDGSFRWRYPSHAFMDVGGPLAVSNQMLFVGTQGSVDQPETSALYAINTEDGSLRWYYLMGDYVGATSLNNVVYVASGDQHLYAFNISNGTVLWRYKFPYPVSISNPTLALNGILYINVDGAYALDSTNGSVLWHKSLGSSQSVYFLPSVVVDGVDYLASTDGYGNSTLYALNASTGAEYWHISNLNQISPLAVA